MISVSDATEMVECKLHSIKMEVRDGRVLCGRCEKNYNRVRNMNQLSNSDMGDIDGGEQFINLMDDFRGWTP